MSDIDSTVSLDQSIQSVSIDATLSISGTVTATQSTQAVVIAVDVVYAGGVQAVQRLSGQATVHYSLDAVPIQPIQALMATGYAIDIAATATTSQAIQSISADATVTVFSNFSSVTQPLQRLTSYATQSTVVAPTPEALSAKLVVSSRRDLQIPRTPLNHDKQTQAWFTSVGKIIQKYVFGEDGSRLVSAADLAKLGIVGVNPNGTITTPRGNLTTPPKVTGLTANGALASIVIQWRNPSFVNYGYTELWRSSVDDVGQAVIIAKTAVESYIDNVGSAATKYYWARAVTDSGVHGEFNAARGVLGQTSFDPDYVKQLLTTVKWLPNTTYAPYQYVQPTVENGFQYMVIDGGVSASTEPTWPTTVSHTISDGTIEWQCIAATDRLPLVIGELEDGSPAVFIDTAFIKNASITSAKIGDLVAEKITTGDLNADLQVLSKLWYGFNLPNGSYFNSEDDTTTLGNSGFYLGVNGSVPALPVLHLNTGIANGSQSLYFDGTQLKLENVNILSSADGTFDDLRGDSVDFSRANFDFLAFKEQVVASQYVTENGITVSNPKVGGVPEFNQYLCYPNGCQKTQHWQSSSLIIGTGYSRPYAFFQTGEWSAIKPYDYRSNLTRYRANKENIGFSILIDAPAGGTVGNYYGGNYLDIYVLSESQSLTSSNYNSGTVTDGIPSQYLLKIPVTYHRNGTVTAYKNTGSGDVAVFDVDVVIDQQTNPNQTLIICDDDLAVLGFKGSRTLKIAVVYKAFWQAGGSDDATGYGQITAYMQMKSIAGDLNVPNNDATLNIIPTAQTAEQFLSLNKQERNALMAIIYERINYREPL